MPTAQNCMYVGRKERSSASKVYLIFPQCLNVFVSVNKNVKKRKI